MSDRRGKTNSSGHKPPQNIRNSSYKSRSGNTNNNGTQSRHPDSPQSPNSPGSNAWSKKSPSNSSGNNNNRQNSRKNTAHHHYHNDNVRRIVQEEGRSARNLITWSVPLENDGEDRPRRPLRRLSKPINKRDLKKSETESETDIGTPDSKKDRKDVRARYWAFLFDNLERAVDEIYKTCEADESEVQCKEAIMMLEHSSRDFKSLIERLRVIREFETAQTRPTSLAWELRKTSPGKTVSPVVPDRLVAATAKRILNMTKTDPAVETSTSTRSSLSVKSPNSVSYADRVRGIRPMINEVREDDQSSVASSVEGRRGVRSSTAERSTSPDLEDGWETVHNARARRNRHKTNGKASSCESLNSVSSSSRRGGRASSNVDRSSAESDHKVELGNEADVINPPPEVPPVINGPVIETAAPPVMNGDQSNHEPDENQMNGADSDEEEEDEDEDGGDDGEDDYAEMQAKLKLYDELEVMNEALQAEQALEMNNNIDDAVTEQMKKEEQEAPSEEAPTEEAGTQTADTPTVITWDSLVEAYRTNQSLSWSEMVEVEERTPGRSVQMHEKLSSPSRKPSAKELSKKHVEKQQKAAQLREKLMQEKAERLRELAKKVEIVNQLKEEIGEQRRDVIEQKMRAAEQKRNRELRKRMQKAHDEETKANEIAFINTLEAQNKKHDIETKHQECQARLMDIAEERQRRNEEKAAKEAAVEERRKALEADRLARLQEIQERRKQRETEFEQRQQEKEKERIENARAKEKDREERIAAMKAQHEAQIEELRAKIQEKQDESARRHSENLAQIREKAFEMSILRHSNDDDNDVPRLTPYDKKKMCLVCNVLLPSEVHLSSHLRGKKHQQSMIASSSVKNMTKKDIENFNLEHIKDAPSDRPDLQMKNDSERRKALKKRCKKLRQRMSARGAEYENTLISGQNNSENKHKMQKAVKDINKALQSQSTGPWAQDRVSALDRALGDVGRYLDKNCKGDKESFCTAGGVTSICRILMAVSDSPSAQLIPDKSLVLCSTVLRRVCTVSLDNCRYMLFSNKLGVLVDFLASRLALLPPEGFDTASTSGKHIQDSVATALIQALVTILISLTDLNDNNADLLNRKNDIISYLVSVGVVDRIRLIFSYVRQPIENNAKASDFLDACIQLIQSAVTLLSSAKNHAVFDSHKKEDSTLLIQTVSNTELCGVVSLLYSVLLHTGSNAKRDESPVKLPDKTLDTVTKGMELLNSIARMNITTFQTVLGEEGTWLEFRHICSYLIWYCSHFSSENLLHEVIIAVGYFTVLCTDNQQYIQSGQSPTVLQQLCSLPFQYFSNARLTQILFPTLISCSYNNQSNRQILESELSCALLANYIEEHSQPCKNNNENSLAKLKNRFPESECEAAIKYFKA